MYTIEKRLYESYQQSTVDYQLLRRLLPLGVCHLDSGRGLLFADAILPVR